MYSFDDSGGRSASAHTADEHVSGVGRAASCVVRHSQKVRGSIDEDGVRQTDFVFSSGYFLLGHVPLVDERRVMTVRRFSIVAVAFLVHAVRFVMTTHVHGPEVVVLTFFDGSAAPFACVGLGGSNEFAALKHSRSSDRVQQQCPRCRGRTARPGRRSCRLFRPSRPVCCRSCCSDGCSRERSGQLR